MGVNLADPWGNNVQIGNPNWNNGFHDLRSAGPDGKFRTGDDIVGSVVDPWCARSYGYSDTIRITFERAPIGSGEITGTVKDPAGAAVAGTLIRIVEAATGKTHTLKAGPDGRFSLTALPGGRYRIEAVISGLPGFTERLRAPGG